MSEKHISTLVKDIYDIVIEGKEPTEEHLDLFANGCKEILRTVLAKGLDKTPRKTIRMSNLGTRDRRLWYSCNGAPQDDHTPHQLISFMYGHIIEEFALLLVRHSGHTVTDQQKVVHLEGIKGHMDGKIDGVLTDVKGMSPFGFDKFADGSIARGKDTFGYIDQISGYALAEDEDQAAFLVVNKLTGKLFLAHYDADELTDSRARAIHAKVMITEPEEPQRCFDPIPMGKAGNMVLPKECGFCPFKRHCHRDANGGKGLREFEYSTGTEYFTQVIKPPRVGEVNAEEE